MKCSAATDEPRNTTPALTIALGGGADVAVIVGSEIDGRTMIRSGSGADNVSVSDSTFHARVDALLGGANDLFFTGQTDVFSVFLNVDGESGKSDQAMVSNNLFAGATFDSIEQLDIFPNVT